MAIGDNNSISPQFWKNLVTEKVYDAFTIRAKAVESLQTFVKWFFGLFSSGSFLLIFFGKDSLDTSTLVIWGAGVGLLLFGSLRAAESGFPNVSDVDVTDSASIETGYSKAVRKSNKQFRTAYWFITIGVFMVALGILLEFASGQPPKFRLNTYLEKRDGMVLLPFVIQGDKKNHAVDLVISGTDSLSAGNPFLVRDALLLNQSFVTDKDGQYRGVYVLPLDFRWKYIRFTASAMRVTGLDSVYDMITKTVLYVPKP